MSALAPRQRLFLGLVALVVGAAGVCKYAGAPDLMVFGISALALAGVAWVVSFGTEELGNRLPPGPTGLLQSTLGNLPELFVVLFALRDGQIIVAQTSILGSIFANALLVLGITLVIGAQRAEGRVMTFGPRLPKDTTTLLLVTTFIIALVGISIASDDHAANNVNEISIIASVVLLAVYFSWVIPFAREASPDHEPAATLVPLPVTLALLGTAGVAAAFVSEWFVGALQPAIDQLGVSQAFAGIVIVAIAGNAVENVTAFVLAAKGKNDLAISVVKNSVAQIAAFLFPVLVLASQFFESKLTFSIQPVYIGALLLTALALWQITGDGEAAAFEGWALTGLYVILGALTLFE